MDSTGLHSGYTFISAVCEWHTSSSEIDPALGITHVFLTVLPPTKLFFPTHLASNVLFPSFQLENQVKFLKLDVCTPSVKRLREFVKSREIGKEFQAPSYGHQRNKKVRGPDFKTATVFPNALDISPTLVNEFCD